MSEEKQARPIEEIQKEYGETCAILGDRAYKSEMLKLDIQQLNQKLYELNKEASVYNKPTNVEPLKKDEEHA